MSLKNSKSEEVNDLVERMPTKFGTIVTGLIVLIFLFVVFFGWFVKYPDVIAGEITINSTHAPVKLIANTSGKLMLLKEKSGEFVEQDEYIGYVQNSAKISDIRKLFEIIKKVPANNVTASPYLTRFSKKLILGELNQDYFAFINSRDQLLSNREHNPYEQQQKLIVEDVNTSNERKNFYQKKISISHDNINLQRKSFLRDSVLFAKRYESATEFEKSKINLLNNLNEYQSLIKEANSNKQEITDLQGKLEQTVIQKNEKERQNELDCITAYTNLIDKLNLWEIKYVFKSPINGQVQFLKFWENNEFIQAGEPVFNMVPNKVNIIGQMHLPTKGVGKVRVGQDVIIKLDNYPYMEYGSITGKVTAISLTTNIEKSGSGDVDLYLVNVSLPNQLKTNYGPQLEFKFEIKGTGDIITNDRRLIERLFDNLKYVFYK